MDKEEEKGLPLTMELIEECIEAAKKKDMETLIELTKSDKPEQALAAHALLYKNAMMSSFSTMDLISELKRRGAKEKRIPLKMKTVLHISDGVLLWK